MVRPAGRVVTDTDLHTCARRQKSRQQGSGPTHVHACAWMHASMTIEWRDFIVERSVECTTNQPASQKTADLLTKLLPYSN